MSSLKDIREKYEANKTIGTTQAYIYAIEHHSRKAVVYLLEAGLITESRGAEIVGVSIMDFRDILRHT